MKNIVLDNIWSTLRSTEYYKVMAIRNLLNDEEATFLYKKCSFCPIRGTCKQPEKKCKEFIKLDDDQQRILTYAKKVPSELIEPLVLLSKDNKEAVINILDYPEYYDE